MRKRSAQRAGSSNTSQAARSRGDASRPLSLRSVGRPRTRSSGRDTKCFAGTVFGAFRTATAFGDRVSEKYSAWEVAVEFHLDLISLLYCLGILKMRAHQR